MNSSPRAMRRKPQVRCAPLRVDAARGSQLVPAGPGRSRRTETMYKIHNLRRAIIHRSEWGRNTMRRQIEDGAGWPVVRSWTAKESAPRSACGSKVCWRRRGWDTHSRSALRSIDAPNGAEGTGGACHVQEDTGATYPKAPQPSSRCRVRHASIKVLSRSNRVATTAMVYSLPMLEATGSE
jgi:hypothetical protein